MRIKVPMLFLSLLFTSCTFSQNKIRCESYDCVEVNKNKKASIFRVLVKSSIEDWEWKILLKDSNYIYVNSASSKLKIKDFENKKVLMKGTIFYGVVRGENDGKSSFAYGYRFDPDFVELFINNKK